MSLVEVIVAMMILVGVLLALGRFMAMYAQASGQARLTIVADELAAQRLDAVRSLPNYGSVIALAEANKAVVSDNMTYTRTTTVKRIGGGPTDSLDYSLVTVVVTHPSLRKSVSKTTALAAF